MPLVQYGFKPGIDKQNTSVGAEQRWVDSDNVRFRYGLPEKVGGWNSLVTDSIAGVSRKLHAFVDLDGNRYVAIGTDKFLILYFEGQLFDITPVKANLTINDLAFTDTEPTVTATTSTSHGLAVGDIVQFSSTTLPGGTGFTAADFDGLNFIVQTVPSATTFTVTMASNSGATANGGGATLTPYETVGPAEQTYGYGWGAGTWSREGWNEAASASDVTLEPGLWSLDNFGEVLIATIANGKTFTWNAGATNATTIRASTTTSGFSTASNPTATRVTLVSPTTRHLVHLGTETTIGDASTQDDMFIRFSDQEDINDYTATAINSAGDFRLQDGTKIMGAIKAKETILVFTDNALYTMKFIGAPFTFGFEQVGTNCGLIGKNAVVEQDGVAYWISNNGFFLYDGTVKSLPCSVEDFVYDNFDTTKGQQVYAGLNNLYTEIIWYYPTQGADFNDAYVVYNYGERVWYTGTEARSSWIDAIVYPNPYATKYNSSETGTFPSMGGTNGLGQTIFFEHEVGTDQVNPDGTTTTVTSFIKSFDFDLDVQGNGEFFLALRRFVPDFKTLENGAKVTLAIKRYPQDSDTTTSLSPFSITSTTTKKDTRARGRFCNIKIENDDISQTWRFGTLRLDLQPDGRR
mgnify:FL=1